MNKQQHNRTKLPVWLLGLMVFAVFCNAVAAIGVNTQTKPDTTAKVHLVESYGKLPLSFEANRGQADKKVQFISRGQGYGLFLTPTEAVLSLHKSVSAGSKTGQSPGRTLPFPAGQTPGKVVQSSKDKAATLRMKLVGSNPNPHIQGLEELPGKINYFRGKDPRQWQTNVPTYGKVKYKNVYPGIDLVYYGNQRQLEHDFIVAPGADPKAIRLAFEGVDTLSIDKQGDLSLKSAGDTVNLRKPRVYQDINGQRHEIEGRYVLRPAKSHSKGKVGFQVAEYDRSRPLVIDPVLVYSTYLGGSGTENLNNNSGIAVDSAGNAYVTGSTESGDFHTVNAKYPQYQGGNTDAFVTKLSADGQTVIYSTYLGGSNWDVGKGIAVDTVGNATLTGQTDSVDFPTANAKYPQLGGFSDAFVTKLSADGQTMIYSTYPTWAAVIRMRALLSPWTLSAMPF